MSAYNFFCQWTKVHKFFVFNAGKIMLVNAVYSWLISSSIPKIFALKVESFLKSHLSSNRQHYHIDDSGG